jgi:hypothetical protein
VYILLIVYLISLACNNEICIYSLFLRNHVTEEEEPCALWCIAPKYSIKSEGDFVMHGKSSHSKVYFVLQICFITSSFFVL